MDQVRYRGGVALAYTMVLSMPPGTPGQAVEAAAHAFADQEFATHDRLAVLHLDRPHPHVHLALRGEDDEGRSRPFTMAEVYRWPQAFAEKLRSHGVPADGSPRWERGVVLRPEAPRLRRAREKYEAGKASPPRILVEDHQEALQIARGAQAATGRWEALMEQRQRKVRESYLGLADRLEAMDQVGDQALAAELRRFVADMPPVRTRRDMLVDQAREYDRRMASREATQQQREAPLRER